MNTPPTMTLEQIDALLHVLGHGKNRAGIITTRFGGGPHDLVGSSRFLAELNIAVTIAIDHDAVTFTQIKNRHADIPAAPFTIAISDLGSRCVTCGYIIRRGLIGWHHHPHQPTDNHRARKAAP